MGDCRTRVPSPLAPLKTDVLARRRGLHALAIPTARRGLCPSLEGGASSMVTRAAQPATIDHPLNLSDSACP